MNQHDADALGREIDHFLDFNMSPKAVAERLGCHLSTVEKHIARQRMRNLASEERATVTSRSSTERGNY